MYIPASFGWKDQDAILDFVRQHNFAVLVTNGADGRPRATHLPFSIELTENKLKLTAHLSKANPQWREFEGQEVLVIFNGPHAYISPANYEKQQNVPTWNYIAVHVYGAINIVTDEARGYEILEAMMRESEPEFLKQWATLSEAYKSDLYSGIVPFEITITNIEAKHKLSQNKTAAERENIINDLSAQEGTPAQEIAAAMKKIH